MSLRVAVQMDPIQNINIKTDTTLALMLEAERRGHDLWYYTPDYLSLEGGIASTKAQPVKVQNCEHNHASLGMAERCELKAFDVILLRQDPPFDMNYITTTHILERVMSDVLVVNNPVSVRNAPEKILVTEFPELMAPTLISRDIDAIDAFRQRYQDIVMKPLYGHGGAGVFRLKPDDTNYRALCEHFTGTGSEPWVTQVFLPEVVAGDKRVFLIDGLFAGAINRKSMEGDIRSNMVRGGHAELADLTDREQFIVDTIGPHLKAKGLLFVGIDLIGETITEINVTSPTGLKAFESQGGGNLAETIWQTIERKL